ncbi:MAG: hypothetical protein EPO07_02105 [Verrucomicrobia bacterium]|nr:MAG: hypothetical protein EPO07_02105 [Verrucomicrobiota bacterium]
MKVSIAIVPFLAATLLAPQLPAATVTTTADSGAGSLRSAIASAVPGETIDFAVTGTIALTSGELLIDKNLTITGPGANNLSIQRSTLAGTPDFRVFNIQSGIVNISGLTASNGRAPFGAGINNEATSTVRDCVVSANAATDGGGGIANLSTLVLSNCVLAGNSIAGGVADGTGGGVFNNGTLTSLHCRFSSNSVVGATSAAIKGGGICNGGGGTLTISDSVLDHNAAIGSTAAAGSGGGIYNQGTATIDTTTVDSNRAEGSSGTNAPPIPGFGGGIANNFGTVTMVRSTVSRNSATSAVTGGFGGGIGNGLGTVTMTNSTVSGNIAGGIYNSAGSLTLDQNTITANLGRGSLVLDGGGLANDAGVVEIRNTILAGNMATTDLINAGSGLIRSDGFNLIGSTNGSVTPGPNDQFNLTAAQLKIGSLQDNGGPTFTHALLCGSPAIDAGDSTNAPATDQRGFARIVGSNIDIGAFEYKNAAPTIACSAAITNCVPSGQDSGTTLSANVADADGDPLVVVWSVQGASLQTNIVAAGGPPTTARVDFTVLFSPGTHQVTASVADPSECVATCSTILALNPGPRVRAANDAPICSGSTLHLTASSPTAVSFNWSGPNGFSSTAQNPVITNATKADVGAYTVTVTDTNGCSASDTTTPAINPSPRVTAGNNGPVCEGSTLNLTADSSPTAVSFKWSGPNGFSSSVQNPTVTNLTAVAAGIYTVMVTDTNGCTASDTTTATINPSPSVTAGNNGPVCEGSTLNLTANSSPTAVSFKWSGPNGFSSSVQNPTVTNVTTAAAGIYTVTVTDSNGCTATATTAVAVIARGDLYPIALHVRNVTGVPVGASIADIYNGVQPGNFGWLTWAGNPSEPTLVTSLTPPGNSSTYINPKDRGDRVVSIGDWVQGKPGVSNGDKVRKALDTLKQIDIVVPVWDRATGSGNRSLYHVVAFARVRIVSYQLPKQNRITARFLGFVPCE